MKRVYRTILACVLAIGFILSAVPVSAFEEPTEVILTPAYPVFDYVEHLLETARGELGEGEDAHGNSKYGIWA